jgi:hypothetical protein
MARKKHGGIQQDAAPARVPSQEEQAREATHRHLAAWLEERGYKPNRLPHYRQWVRSGKPGSYFLGPPCRRLHRLYGDGAVRRASDHACVACTLHLPAGHARPVMSRAEKRKARRESPRQNPRSTSGGPRLSLAEALAVADAQFESLDNDALNSPIWRNQHGT